MEHDQGRYTDNIQDYTTIKQPLMNCTPTPLNGLCDILGESHPPHKQENDRKYAPAQPGIEPQRLTESRKETDGFLTLYLDQRGETYVNCPCNLQRDLEEGSCYRLLVAMEIRIPAEVDQALTASINWI
jgi:hypothetical protein